jgi:hypothetical protein
MSLGTYSGTQARNSGILLGLRLRRSLEYSQNSLLRFKTMKLIVMFKLFGVSWLLTFTDIDSRYLQERELMQHLMTHMYDPNVWKGLLTSYVINYHDKIRQHGRLCKPAPRSLDYAKSTMLQAAVATIPSLNNIKNKCNLSLAQGLVYPNFDAYYAIIKAAVLIHDEETVACFPYCASKRP